MPRDKLHIHIKTVENGYIMKDLTDQKDKEWLELKTYVATSMKDLKSRINILVDDHLPSHEEQEAEFPPNAFDNTGGR